MTTMCGRHCERPKGAWQSRTVAVALFVMLWLDQSIQVEVDARTAVDSSVTPENDGKAVDNFFFYSSRSLTKKADSPFDTNALQR